MTDQPADVTLQTTDSLTAVEANDWLHKALYDIAKLHGAVVTRARIDDTTKPRTYIVEGWKLK